MASKLFIVSAKRTPFGAFGGKLKGMTATDLATHSNKSAIAAAKINPELIDSCIIGNVAQTSTDAAYISRHAGLRAGLRASSTALTVNRLCGSGFEAVIAASRELLAAGECANGIAIAGGAESMSQAPLSVYGQHVRFGHRLGSNLEQVDTLWSALTDSYCKLPMGITAENLAERYHISRRSCDEYSARSQQLWQKANAEGIYAREIAPIEGLKGGKKGLETMMCDEHPRPDTTADGLSKLPAVFKKEGGVVTAAGSSGICDGAASLVIATEDAVRKHNLSPLARIVGWNVTGVEPSIMGIGPAPAIRALLHKYGLTLAQMDMIEINEAFAAQVLAVEKDLVEHEYNNHNNNHGRNNKSSNSSSNNIQSKDEENMEKHRAVLLRNKLNIHGGAIALGHPLGASGARILTHLANCLSSSSSSTGSMKYGLGAACIGGGQGIAMLLEKV